MPVGDGAMSHDTCLSLCLQLCIKACVALHCEGVMLRELTLWLKTFSASHSADMTAFSKRMALIIDLYQDIEIHSKHNTSKIIQ